MLLVALVLQPTVLAAEKQKLVVALTAGRDPNINLIQDYGDIKWTDALKQAFNRQYPDIEIEYTKVSLDQVAVAMAAGIGPDIVNGCCSGFRNLGVNGALVDLTPYIGKVIPNFMAQKVFWPPQWEAFQANGRQFALPQYLGTIALYYNVDMFNQAGIPLPSPDYRTNTLNWDGFAQVLKKLTRDLNGDGQTDVWGLTKGLRGDRLGYWMLAAGAEFYKDGNHAQSALDDPRAVMALDYLANLRFTLRMIPPPGQTARWEEGKTAILEDGSWRLVSFLGLTKEGRPKIPFQWNVAPLPMGPVRRATLATIDGYAINKNTKHLEAALKYLAFLAGPEANRIRAQYIGLQPAHRAVVGDYVRLMQQLNRDISTVDVQVFTDAGAYAFPQYLYTNQQEADRILNEAYDRILQRQEPAASVWMDAVRRLNTVLAGP